MIVLNAANKSLILEPTTINPFDAAASVTSVVSYWSIDGANVWTPDSFETKTVGPGPSNTMPLITILPGPSGGEVRRVVENIWLRVFGGSSLNGVLNLTLLAGSDRHLLAGLGQGTGIGARFVNMTFVMKRDGSFARVSNALGDGTSGSPVQVNADI